MQVKKDTEKLEEQRQNVQQIHTGLIGVLIAQPMQDEVVLHSPTDSDADADEVVVPQSVLLIYKQPLVAPPVEFGYTYQEMTPDAY